MKLRGFEPEAFLREYWQKQPLLIRNAWAGWHNPLEPDELAGLACEEAVESRLITQSPGSLRLENGPLAESRFGKLGKNPWTLLVQAVDHHAPEVATLLDSFRFIPNWRIDDVMVSYATDGGGVGPHFDQYDVFLVQGLGQRRWQLGQLCDHDTELMPHDDLRLLANFEPVEEWVLDPGDILYVPPRLAHNGIAIGDDCMTYSIGFRAPSRHELIANWPETMLAGLDDDDRYGDPGASPPGNPGEISDEAIAQLHAMALEGLLDRDAFARWFGGYSTAPKNPDIQWQPLEPITLDQARQLIDQNYRLLRNPASRCSFIRQPSASLLLFVDGECFSCAGEAAAFAEGLCAQSAMVITASMISPQMMDLLLELLNKGSVTFDFEG